MENNMNQKYVKKYIETYLVPNEEYYKKDKYNLFTSLQPLTSLIDEKKPEPEKEKMVLKFSQQYAHFIKTDENFFIKTYEDKEKNLFIEKYNEYFNQGDKYFFIEKDGNSKTFYGIKNIEGYIDEYTYKPIPEVPNTNKIISEVPYIIDVWDKMYIICDIMSSQTNKDTDASPATAAATDADASPAATAADCYCDTDASANTNTLDSAITSPVSATASAPNGGAANAANAANASDNDVINKIISFNIGVANEEKHSRASKLRKRVTFVMSIIMNNLYLLAEENKEDNAKTEIVKREIAKIDFFDFKELIECMPIDACVDVDNDLKVQYNKIMKGSQFKVKILQKKGKLPIKQEPYIMEISSYKLAKDFPIIFPDTLKRNVRISSLDLIEPVNTDNNHPVVRKKAWYILSKIDEILTHTQLFFTYIKIMYANTTINMKNNLEKIDIKLLQKNKIIKQDISSDDVKRLTTQISEMSNKIFSRVTARLYGKINEFIEKIIRCEEIDRKYVVGFNNVINSIKEDINRVNQTGGGFFNRVTSVLNNALTTMVAAASGLLSMVSISITNIMRFLADMSPGMAKLISSLIVVSSCGASIAALSTGVGVLFGIGMARYCALGIGLAIFSFSNSAEEKVKKVQDKFGQSMNTTSVIMMIMKYGAFKELHPILEKGINDILRSGSGGMIETEFKELETSIADKLDIIAKSPNNSFAEQNMYVFHGKLQDMLQKAQADAKASQQQVNIENFEYFRKNTPITSNDLKKAIDIMIGDLSVDYRLFPKNFTNEQKLELNYGVSSKFTDIDVRNFVLIKLSESFNGIEYIKDIKIDIFKSWMVGENLENKISIQKKKLACETMKLTNILKSNVKLEDKEKEKERAQILSFIDQLQNLERYSEPQSTIKAALHLVYNAGIEHILEKHVEKHLKKDQPTPDLRPVLSFEDYRKILRIIAIFINEVQSKIKYPSRTILISGYFGFSDNGNEFDDMIKNIPKEQEKQNTPNSSKLTDMTSSVTIIAALGIMFTGF